MKKWYFILIAIVFIALIWAWIHSFWPVVSVQTRYEPINQIALDKNSYYEGISQAIPGSVPEYEKIKTAPNTVLLNRINRIEENEEHNVTGEINFLTNEYMSPNENIPFEVRDGEVFAKYSEENHINGVLNVAYADAKERQSDLRNENFGIFMKSLWALIPLIAGILYFKFAEEIARFSLRLTIRDAEPSDFNIFMTKIGGIFLIIVSLYFVLNFMSMY